MARHTHIGISHGGKTNIKRVGSFSGRGRQSVAFMTMKKTHLRLFGKPVA